MALPWLRVSRQEIGLGPLELDFRPFSARLGRLPESRRQYPGKYRESLPESLSLSRSSITKKRSIPERVENGSRRIGRFCLGFGPFCGSISVASRYGIKQGSITS